MKVLLLDDEKRARANLRHILSTLGIVDVREASTVAEALGFLQEERPDVLLLDVELRGGRSGFEILDALPAEGIPAIFITGHEEHAVKAFEVRAVDYVLKPVDAKRLKEGLMRVTAGQRGGRRFGNHDKVLFRDGSHDVLVRVGDIHALESSGAYTHLVLGDRSGSTVNGTMKSVRERLNPELFFQANRTQSVNLDHIADVTDGGDGQMVLVMENGMRIEVSRRQAVEFRRLKSV